MLCDVLCFKGTIWIGTASFSGRRHGSLTLWLLQARWQTKWHLPSGKCTTKCRNRGGWFRWGVVQTVVGTTTTLMQWSVAATGSSRWTFTCRGALQRQRHCCTGFCSSRRRSQDRRRSRCGTENKLGWMGRLTGWWTAWRDERTEGRKDECMDGWMDAFWKEKVREIWGLATPYRRRRNLSLFLYIYIHTHTETHRNTHALSIIILKTAITFHPCGCWFLLFHFFMFSLMWTSTLCSSGLD